MRLIHIEPISRQVSYKYMETCNCAATVANLTIALSSNVEVTCMGISNNKYSSKENSPSEDKEAKLDYYSLTITTGIEDSKQNNRQKRDNMTDLGSRC